MGIGIGCGLEARAWPPTALDLKEMPWRGAYNHVVSRARGCEARTSAAALKVSYS